MKRLSLPALLGLVVWVIVAGIAGPAPSFAQSSAPVPIDFARQDPCPGATICGDFTTSRFKGFGSITSRFQSLPNLTVTRASGGYAENPDGSLVWFQPGQARVTRKGLGVFEATTNLILQSGTVGNGSWSSAGSASSALNTDAAPDGTVTASRITTTSFPAGYFATTSGTLTAGTTYITSGYFKLISGGPLLRLVAAGQSSYGGSGGDRYVTLNASSCSSGTTSGVDIQGFTLTPAAGGWCRVTVKFTPTSTASSATAFYSDTATSVFDAWGADVRAGSLPVPYCPTTSSTATCAADVIKIGGWSYGGAFSLYTQATISQLKASNYLAWIDQAGGATYANASSLQANNGVFFTERLSGGVGVNFSGLNWSAGNTVRDASSFDGATLRGYANGVQVNNAAAASQFAASPDTLYLGGYRDGAGYLDGYIQSFALYPTAMGAAQLQSLTAGPDTSSLSLNFASGTYRTTTPYVRTNVILWSQDYTNADWTKSAGGVTTTANSTAAPDGSLTGSKIAYGAGTTAEYVYKSAKVSFTSGVSYTQSYYVKIGSGIQYVQIPFNPSNFSGNIYANFDVSSCTWTAVASGVTARAALAGNGWCRVSATAAATATGAGDAAYSCWAVPSGSSTFAPTFTYAGTEFCYAWGGQVEATPSATSYIATTTASASVATTQSVFPQDVGALTVTRTTTGGVGSYAQNTAGALIRFADNIPRIVDQGLLVEEARTNILYPATPPATVASTYVLNNWGKDAGVTWTPANATGPDGTALSAGTVSMPAGGVSSQSFGYAFTGTAAAWSGGFWAKGTTGQQVYAYADTGGGASKTLVTFTGQWQRIGPASQTLTAVTTFLYLDTKDRLGTAHLPAVTFQLWKGQAELGSFLTSQIDTTSAAVTRSADVVSYGGLSYAAPYTLAGGGILSVQSNAGRFAAMYDGANTLEVASNGASRAGDVGGTALTLTDVGPSMTYPAPTFVAANNVAGTVRGSGNGQAASAVTGAGPGTVTSLFIGNNVSASRAANGYIQQVRIYPYAAADGELAYRSAGNF